MNSYLMIVLRLRGNVDRQLKIQRQFCSRFPGLHGELQQERKRRPGLNIAQAQVVAIGSQRLGGRRDAKGGDQLESVRELPGNPEIASVYGAKALDAALQCLQHLSWRGNIRGLAAGNRRQPVQESLIPVGTNSERAQVDPFPRSAANDF